MFRMIYFFSHILYVAIRYERDAGSPLAEAGYASSSSQ